MSEKYIRFAADKLSRAGFTDIQYVTDDEQGADILATAKSGAHVCIKCVYTDKPVMANAVNEVYQAKKAYGCSGAMVLTNSTFTEKAEEFAGKAKVVLKKGVTIPPSIDLPEITEEMIDNISMCPAPKNTKPCRYCYSDIDENATICPVCGMKVKKPIYKRWWFIVLSVWLGFTILGSIIEPVDDSGEENAEEQQTSQAQQDESDAETVSAETPDISEYTAITADDLRNYAQYMIGENIVTETEVTSKSSSALKTKFPDNDTFYFDFVFNFTDKSKIKEIEEESTAAVAGTIKEVDSKGTVVLSDCIVVGNDQLPENAFENSSAVVESYRQLAEEKAAQEQAAQEERDAQIRTDYIASCETLTYSDVLRNPEQFKGKPTKISGTVIQVQEYTLFETTSVTLRVDTGDNNIWYVSYTRLEGESRILEDDWITCYGNCEGVESYTTVLGAQVTIPSMKMRFYE